MKVVGDFEAGGGTGSQRGGTEDKDEELGKKFGKHQANLPYATLKTD